MRHALILASILLCCGCGDDDEDGTPDAGGGGGDDEGITWHCTCWSQRDGAERVEESILRCSATDPTDMLDDRAAAAAENAGLTGGCDACEEGDESCVLED